MTRFRNLFVITIGSALLHSAEAQITDSEDSATMLAYQCSISSGYSVDGYMPYARGLARTIAQVSPAGQEDVFGFLPSLGGVSGSASDSVGSTATPETSAAIGESSDPTAASGSSSGSGWLAAFFDWVASLL